MSYLSYLINKIAALQIAQRVRAKVILGIKIFFNGISLLTNFTMALLLLQQHHHHKIHFSPNALEISDILLLITWNKVRVLHTLQNILYTNVLN